MKPYVSIDLETTGLNPKKCMILQVGMVIDDWVSPIADLPRLELLVDNGPFITGEPYALQMNAELIKRIADGESSVYEHELAHTMRMWLVANNYDGTILAAGKNFGAFDLQFLNRMSNFDIWLKFDHRSHDPGSMYFDPKIDDKPPSLATCLERAGIAKHVAHTALEDAIDVVTLIRKKYDNQ